MQAFDLIKTLKNKLEDADIKDGAKESFNEVIAKINSKYAKEKLTASDIISLLNLQELDTVTDEDGYFTEFVNTNVQTEGVNPQLQNTRTKIFYLMNKEQVSCLHILDIEEKWQWIQGSAVSLYLFHENSIKAVTLDEKTQEYTIPKNTLFAAKNVDITNFSLVTCECRPGFHPQHYKIPSNDQLKDLFLHHQNDLAIAKLLKLLTPRILKEVSDIFTFPAIEPTHIRLSFS
jgi:uncharacterized protein